MAQSPSMQLKLSFACWLRIWGLRLVDSSGAFYESQPSFGPYHQSIIFCHLGLLIICMILPIKWCLVSVHLSGGTINFRQCGESWSQLEVETSSCVVQYCLLFSSNSADIGVWSVHALRVICRFDIKLCPCTAACNSVVRESTSNWHPVCVFENILWEVWANNFENSKL